MPSHSQKGRSAAYSRSVRYYRNGTEEAEIIADLILSRLTSVHGAKGLYVYDYAGIIGYLARRVDRNGLLSFAVYERKDLANAMEMRFKRRKEKYPRAQRPIFLTAPNVWAHLNGYQDRLLRNDEYRSWKQGLEKAAGLDVHAQYEGVKFVLPYLPDADDSKDGDDEIWTSFEITLKRCLRLKRRRLMHQIWRFFVGRWMESAKSVSPKTEMVTGWPRAKRAADGYLALNLGANRRAIERAIKDLDRLGYIQAAFYIPSGLRNKRGIYYYFPASGIPSEQPTRHPEITPRGALHWMRESRREWGRWEREDAERALRDKEIVEGFRLEEAEREGQERADREDTEQEEQERPRSYDELIELEVKRRRKHQQQEDI
jgi:hypothetical protein